MRIALSLFGRPLFDLELGFADAPKDVLPAFSGMPLPMLMPPGAMEQCTDECCVPPAPAKTPLGFTAPEKKS